MVRNILSVVLGYSLWTALWLGGNALLFSAASEQMVAEEGMTNTGTLLGVLGLSVVCSLCAGFLTAKIAANQKVQVAIMAFFLLVTGIMVQMAVWNLMPLWYHFAFLILLLPMARMGARLARAS